MHNYEILQMKAEFFRDDWKLVWFYFAKDIFGRPSKNKKALSSIDAKKQAKKLQENKEAMRKQMISELS